ncbi:MULTISPECIES: citryl-CoA lyase [unclassified Sporosarcina]|uniref:citryl-CoA lyase n=1 Tax=unclassified Sporosarcina TaxID=2647733 RepID=UPI0009C03684|nr:MULTISPECIES: citryl-CoA lyase [unclassified Sporosarcina]ARD47957.1 citryl-CoA lyase [Sporosarcina sp. P33]PID18357.1 citryl-CoA lyase [Sporosarcina sp. P35]
MKFETKVGYSETDKVFVHGHNLVDDLIGEITLADMAFLGAKHRKPNANESKMLNALMVAVCEHGFTPSSISTRLTYLGAPEAVQAAVAAGLLGAGSVYLGAMEQVAEMLQDGMERAGNDKSPKELATWILDDRAERGIQLPGFGHPIHRPVDPRTVKLFELAKELGFYKKNSETINEISLQFNERKGKSITLNAVGAIGAIMADMEFDYRVMKSFAVAARAVGLVAHIVEEIEVGRKDSVGQKIFDYIETNADYKVGVEK